MAIIDWAILVLSLFLAAIGAVLVAAWAVFRAVHPKDGER